jgi:DNA polymerase-1
LAGCADEGELSALPESVTDGSGFSIVYRNGGRVRFMDLLIDADILACQYAYVYEASRRWDADDDFDIDDASWAVAGFDSAVERMVREMGADNAVLCFTGRDNFRYSVLPTYKSNRKGKPKPVLLDPLIEHAWEVWDCKTVDCLEADDVMGIMATRAPGRYAMATIDKDLRQIPGIHYNWKKERVVDVSQRHADYWFYFQVLTGDSTDGYAGCPGIGVRRAERVLEDADPDPWARVVAAFESRGLTEEDALVQARVARILRVEDYNFAEAQPILWSPE